MDFNKALSFIKAHGSERDVARLEYLISGKKPDDNIIKEIVTLQNDDGGFPCRRKKGNPSGINDTVVVLWWLFDLGVRDGHIIDKMCRYIGNKQKEDGSWDEDPALSEYGLPPWITPGNLKTIVYLTANTSYRFVLGGHEEFTNYSKALDFLKKHQDTQGKFFGFLHNTWISTSLFLLEKDKYPGIAEKGLAYLMSRLFSDWIDDQIAWALDYLGQAGLQRSHQFVENGLCTLAQRQNTDGSWASESGEKHSAGATLEVIKVLKHYGLEK